MTIHTRPRARRQWAPDMLTARDATSNIAACRVCGNPIAKGERIHAYTWSEELGAAHAACGFYTPKQDTWADRDAVAIMRDLVGASAAVPPAIGNRAVGLALAKRVHSPGSAGTTLVATPIGAALIKLLRAAVPALEVTP